MFIQNLVYKISKNEITIKFIFVSVRMWKTIGGRISYHIDNESVAKLLLGF